MKFAEMEIVILKNDIVTTSPCADYCDPVLVELGEIL